MQKAADAAHDLMNRYFAKRGLRSPAAEAELVLARVEHDRNRWIDRDLIAKADNILQRAFFDVDDVTENFLNVTLTIGSLEELDAAAGAPVFGLAQPLKREIRICERATYYEPLYRTTIMHEVGHVEMHGEPATRSVAYAPRATRRPRQELEADAFMVAALLPTSVLKLAVALVADRRHINVKEPWGCANSERGRWQWRKLYLPFLISQLCVSRQLLAIQLKRLRVFTQQTLDYHLSYTLPNRWLPTERPGFRRAPMRAVIDELISQMNAGQV